MEKLIILDSNSLINRAYYALPNLTNRSGQFTGAIFGYTAMLLKLIENYKPTHIIATFDRKAPTFRKAIYEQYKATRKGMPEELASQLAPMKRVLSAMNIPIVEIDGFEADDLIGTLAKRFEIPTFIVTGDKDSLQLIDETTTVLLTKKGVSEIVEYDVKRLAEDGLAPSQIVDLKSLMGDASDNIPGVVGIGEKTAMSLLTSYKSLGGVYENIESIKGKLQENLINNKEMAYLSYKLATIKIDVPIEFELSNAVLKTPFDAKLKEVFQELEFLKLAEKVEFSGESVKAEIKKVDFVLIDKTESLENIIKDIEKATIVAICLEQNVFISFNKSKCFEIVINDNLLGEGVQFEDFFLLLKPVLENEKITKLLWDSKIFMHQIEMLDISIVGYQDIALKAYMSDANRNYKNLGELAQAYNLNIQNSSANLYELDEILNREMKEKEVEKLYYELELPLVKVLFDMEREGFAVDKKVLQMLNQKIGDELDVLTSQILGYAGKPFNVNSPKQLSQILFDDLGLRSGKKTKTGLSTNVDVLLSLQNEHPIIPLLLRQRELSKLKSTYLEGMLPLIDSNGRIHTIFKQTVTATGRLSSTEPNLQNIPVRKDEGKLIRQMFVAKKGNRLVVADYSQIELRLMAIFSGDPTMIESFKNNIDIHATTASQVFGVPLDKVTSSQRRQAKAVNFGIIYGISDFGLSNDLGIAVWQAREFIKKYFETYPQVKVYMDNMIALAKEKGYAMTYLGRKREIPEIKSSNFNTRGFGERIAMNMPLQGSASDIIKLAMLKVYKRLNDGNFKSKLIMQVHDELIVDCVIEELEDVKVLLKECMEGVANFDVQLVVDCNEGLNWLDAK